MLISIIIPTHNRNSILRLAIESALVAIQGIDGEIIIVNDSKTEEVILPWQRENVIVIRNPKSGAASAQNYVAKNARCKYLFCR